MNPRKLILLNPYQLPGQSPLTLSNEDMACWLNGYSALWHPAALWGAAGVPVVEATYDHEQPKPDHLYAVPESPPLYMPDDWEQKVREIGAICFRATPDREATLTNLKNALATMPPEAALLALPPDKVTPFFGIGLGAVVSAALAEAMEHENLLDVETFWQDVQQAIAALGGLPFTPVERPTQEGTSAMPPYDEYGAPPQEDFADAGAPVQDFEAPPPADDSDLFAPPSEPEAAAPESSPQENVPAPEEWQRHLQSAADRLLSAREVLYPVAIHLLDMVLLDEEQPGKPLPATFGQGLPVNVVASGMVLEKLSREHPERLADLRERVAREQVEVCGGCYAEREDALLPVESQLWNLLKGQEVARQLLGSEVRVFARQRFGAHPQLPLLLNNAGINRALFLTFDESAVPVYQTPVVNWPSPDGKQVDCFTRTPHPADSPATWFNLAHYLFKTIREDHYATLAFLHRGETASPWYHDLLELCRFVPVLGQWTTFSGYLTQVQAGEYASALSADEFHSDYLSERVPPHTDPEQYAEPGAPPPPRKLPGAAAKVPVSGFASHARARRRIDTCWTLAALQRGLAGKNDPLRVEGAIKELEDDIERTALNALGTVDGAERLVEIEKQIAGTLADRLLSRATADQPGYLILNPCSFTRRVALELDGASGMVRGGSPSGVPQGSPPLWPLPIVDPVKACQVDGDKLRVVVEVPALGFAWIPKAGPQGTVPPAMRMRLADERCVRNEFFEAEIDAATGGLRGIRDHRTGVNRVAQRLVFNPGSVMKATAIRTTSAGPALGEIVAEGMLLGEQEQVLAKFRQRFRAWLGRPLLEMRIEIYPEQPAAGYPWHAYYGSRFAWRDERAVMLRGVNGTGYVTTHVRPQTPDYLELRLARQSTVLFPGGLPFHQRHEGRMLDVILAPEGETANVFDFGIALDREQPMQTALGLITPVPVVPTTKGPPHIGAKGWLFHLDAPNLLLTGLRPGKLEAPAPGTEAPADGMDAITARLLECSAFHSRAEFRCVRDPRRVALLDARGSCL
ncbi:MAG TPA: hypothetical protein VEL76_37490, partial [Gemmataceae bacterium]|nr:hypothetical protein [Gemmataceae bacterium]